MKRGEWAIGEYDSVGMTLDFRNVNMLWASIVAETLSRLGLEQVVICPGSRSAPLAIALAQHPTLNTIPILDERSAGFFALGLAQQSKQAVALLCSSGTAGANVYPAVIEAHESRVPLLVLTADRPPELRDCNAGQTINQQNLYGRYPNLYLELALPSLAATQWAYLRQTLCQSWQRAHFPVPGVVHLNCPFRDPLSPQPDPATLALAESFDPQVFWGGLTPPDRSPTLRPALTLEGLGTVALAQQWNDWLDPQIGLPEAGVIVAGPAQPRSPQAYCEAIAHLSRTLGYPVLAEGLSPLRNYAHLNPALISTYDAIVRHPEWAIALAPQVVIRVGETPTSKALRSWLHETQPLQWVIDAGDRNLDPLHLRSTHLPTHPEALAAAIPNAPAPRPPSAYYQRWLEAETQTRTALDQALTAAAFGLGGKVAWLASQCLPPQTPLFIANSLAVREVEWFWQLGDRHIQPYFNRGANGIDGTLSTALGVAYNNRPSVLLTGDLALLHDTNGFLLNAKFRGHLTIVLVNNQGGGIFQTLPIADFNPPFEEYFATPQAINFAELCQAYQVAYEPIESWEHLAAALKDLPLAGIRLLEIRSDRTQTAQWLQTIFREIPESLPPNVKGR